VGDTRMSDHPIHPWYGPCDRFADGNCFECIKTFAIAKELVADLIESHEGYFGLDFWTSNMGKRAKNALGQLGFYVRDDV